METARVVTIVTVEGSTSVALYALFLCRRDVRIGRNGLWNLRPEHRNLVSDPYLAVLTYGRSGKIESA